ncbi:MAG: hypothetical protein ACK55I_51070, partial [bacterium]
MREESDSLCHSPTESTIGARIEFARLLGAGERFTRERFLGCIRLTDSIERLIPRIANNATLAITQIHNIDSLTNIGIEFPRSITKE